jgi:vitamin B12 transporter
VELALETAPTAALRVLAEYTYLDSEVITASADFDPVYEAGRPLLRRPRHQGSLSARFTQGRLDLGATVLAAGRRADSDFVGLGFLENEGYARLDARVHVRLGAGISAYVAGENLLDRQYEEVLGYPALGRSARAGLRYRGSDRQPHRGPRK